MLALERAFLGESLLLFSCLPGTPYLLGRPDEVGGSSLTLSRAPVHSTCPRFWQGDADYRLLRGSSLLQSHQNLRIHNGVRSVSLNRQLNGLRRKPRHIWVLNPSTFRIDEHRARTIIRQAHDQLRVLEILFEGVDPFRSLTLPPSSHLPSTSYSLQHPRVPTDLSKFQ